MQFKVHKIAGRNRANRFAPRGKIFGATPISGERLIGRFSPHKGRANTATAIDSSEKVAARRACSKKINSRYAKHF
jgi:hypothetical protein